MTNMRLRRIIPPSVLDFVDRWNPRAIRLDDTVNTWMEAASLSDGYASELILERVSNATFEVTEGRAVFERDGVSFTSAEFNWPVLAQLLFAAAKLGHLRVIDVGGSLGSFFWQHRRFLQHIEDLSWTVVEQPNFVARGRSEFATDQLRFVTAEELCRCSEPADVMLLSSVLQYLPDPAVVSDLLTVSGVKYAVIDKTPVVEGPKSHVAVQRVPSSIYSVSYPLWLFSYDSLDRITPAPWKVEAAWSSPGPQRTRKGARVEWRGRFLVRSDVE